MNDILTFIWQFAAVLGTCIATVWLFAAFIIVLGTTFEELLLWRRRRLWL